MNLFYSNNARSSWTFKRLQVYAPFIEPASLFFDFENLIRKMRLEMLCPMATDPVVTQVDFVNLISLNNHVGIVVLKSFNF